jgi:hypothetical protein
LGDDPVAPSELSGRRKLGEKGLVAVGARAVEDLNDVNLWWYSFAHAADGTLWGGDFPAIVPTRAFQWCENTADTSSRTVGMFQFPGGQDDDHVLNFR